MINLIVTNMVFLWYPSPGLEAGIDGHIELRDNKTGIVENDIIQVQSKATAVKFTNETEDSFTYLCSEDDIKYWLSGINPVILVRSRPSTNEAYWVSVKDYFNTAEKIKSRKITFSKKDDKFDATCRDKLLSLVYNNSSQIAMNPQSKEETIYSNLLEVSYYPAHIYLAETDYRTPKELINKLRDLTEDTPQEWVLFEKKILSFCNLREDFWTQICDTGTVEEFYSNEWAFSETEEYRKHFVWLLNRCLLSKVKKDLSFDRKEKCYYFRATPTKIERKYSYQSLLNNTERAVFTPYYNKKDATNILYYRHSAFKG